MQFAFRWQSYDSLFCMNKIVRRYRDLLIANLSGSCIFSEFFPGNEAVVQTSPTAPRSRKTVRFGRVEFFNDSQVLAYARSATNELSSLRPENPLPFIKIGFSRIGREGI
jgi:hypothetical protein